MTVGLCTPDRVNEDVASLLAEPRGRQSASELLWELVVASDRVWDGTHQAAIEQMSGAPVPSFSRPGNESAQVQPAAQPASRRAVTDLTSVIRTRPQFSSFAHRSVPTRSWPEDQFILAGPHHRASGGQECKTQLTARWPWKIPRQTQHTRPGAFRPHATRRAQCPL